MDQRGPLGLQVRGARRHQTGGDSPLGFQVRGARRHWTSGVPLFFLIFFRIFELILEFKNFIHAQARTKQTARKATGGATSGVGVPRLPSMPKKAKAPPTPTELLNKAEVKNNLGFELSPDIYWSIRVSKGKPHELGFWVHTGEFLRILFIWLGPQFLEKKKV